MIYLADGWARLAGPINLQSPRVSRITVISQSADIAVGCQIAAVISQCIGTSDSTLSWSHTGTHWLDIRYQFVRYLTCTVWIVCGPNISRGTTKIYLITYDGPQRNFSLVNDVCRMNSKNVKYLSLSFKHIQYGGEGRENICNYSFSSFLSKIF